MDPYLRLNHHRTKHINTKRPMFSVITATYDKRERQLPICCESVHIQSFTDYEHLIVYELYEHTEIDLPKIKKFIITNPTDWGNVQRRRGIENSIGKWILILDDDNIIYPDTLLNLNKSIISNPDADVIYCSIIYGQPSTTLTPDRFERGHVDTLQWCVRTTIAQKAEWSLWGRCADWEFFNSILKFTNKIHKEKDIIIGEHR